MVIIRKSIRRICFPMLEVHTCSYGEPRREKERDRSAERIPATDPLVNTSTTESHLECNGICLPPPVPEAVGSSLHADPTCSLLRLLSCRSSHHGTNPSMS